MFLLVVGEVMRGLRSWAFLCAVAVAAAIVGCGGSGFGSKASSTTTTSGSTGSTTGSTRVPVATVTIPNEGEALVYTAFLTGSGRAFGDLYMNVEDETISDSYLGRVIPRGQISPIQLHLNAYTFQLANIDVPMTGLNSESFDSITILPYSFATENADGTVGLNVGDTGYLGTDTTTSTISAPTRIRTFPGRDTVVPIFLDDTMFSVDADTTQVGQVVEVAGTPPLYQFQAINEAATTDPTTSGKITAFISDMVQFPLANIPAANVPSLLVSGKKATHFYLSGDNYAFSDDAPTAQSANFEELTLDPTQPIDGLMGQPSSVESQQFQFGNFPGTYDLRTTNPTDITGLSKITSLFGRWRTASSLINLNSASSFDLIVFPNSNESYTTQSPADVVGIAHTGTTITNLYVGYANFSGGAQIAKLYPLTSFVQGTVSGQIVYDLSGYRSSSGTPTTDEPSIRSGSYVKDASSPALPAGFAQSGTFIVFR